MTMSACLLHRVCTQPHDRRDHQDRGRTKEQDHATPAKSEHQAMRHRKTDGAGKTAYQRDEYYRALGLGAPGA